MNCPNCGAVYEGPHRFCGQCGTPLEYEKKGTHWVPLLILLSLSLLGLALFFIFPNTPAPAASWFTLQDGALAFDEASYPGGSEVEVPATIDGKTVSAVGRHGFSDCDAITTVVLPDTVTVIGDYAFSSCNALRALDLPESVTAIGAGAFVWCSDLEAIHIPSGVEEIGQTAFMGCDSLAFIFFDGSAEEWEALYPWSIESHPMICTPDGNSFRSE